MLNEYSFELNQAYLATFGFLGIKNPFTKPAKISEGSEFDKLPVKDKVYPELHGLNGKNIHGQRFWMPTGFKVDGELIQLPNEPIVTVNKSKEIRRQALSDRETGGRVKEVMSPGDFQITIEGIIMDEEKSQFPDDQFELLNYIDSIPGTIEIVNHLTSISGITNVLVESLRWKASVGLPYSKGYVLRLTSDEEFSLTIDEA